MESLKALLLERLKKFMNQFDKQRIADAIWIIEHYQEEIEEILKNEGWHIWEVSHSLFGMLDDIKRNIGA